MISIMTDRGALEYSRTLSGGSHFLAYQCALLSESISSIGQAAALGDMPVSLVGETGGTIGEMTIRHRFKCTGALPVQVSVNDASAVAVDFDFNGQSPINPETGVPTDIAYSTVVALGFRFMQYPQVTVGATYHRGDHVWNGTLRDKVYTCAVDSLEYAGDALADNPDWESADASALIRHPADSTYFADPAWDVVPFFVTSYDSAVTISNGMEWEYKVRVFLDNLLTSRLPELNYFSMGGLEGAGSLMLSFLAGISGALRETRDNSSTIIL